MVINTIKTWINVQFSSISQVTGLKYTHVYDVKVNKNGYGRGGAVRVGGRRKQQEVPTS